MNMLKLGTIMLILGMTGCASTRYLTEEQDSKMREMCEQPGGCAVVPGDVWKAIEKLLGGVSI